MLRMLPLAQFWAKTFGRRRVSFVRYRERMWLSCEERGNTVTFILGSAVLCYTDHFSMALLQNLRTNAKLCRWSYELQEFDTHVVL